MKIQTLNLRDAYGSVSEFPRVSGHYGNGGTSTNPAPWLVSLLQGGKTTAGVNIDEWVAEGMPAIYACVHAYSETVGQTALKMMRRTERGREVDQDISLYSVLHDLANPEMTAYEYREVMTRNLMFWGRAYAFQERRQDGEIKAFWPIHPLRVKVDRDGLNRKRFTVTMDDGVPKEFIHNPLRPDIFHLHMNSTEGLDGRSPIYINRESLGITKAAEDFVAAWFGNGAIPGIVITHPHKLKPGAADHLKNSWWKKFGGAANANKVAVLEEDVKLTIVGADAQKAQLRELREDQIAAAARIYRVPNVIIQNHTKDTSWGSGVEQVMRAWINQGLGSCFTLWKQAIWRDCLNQKTRRTHYAQFVTAPIERGTFKEQMEAYAIMRQNTLANGDEIRELMDMNPIDGGAGETYLIPSGSQVLMGDGMPIESDPAPKTPDPERSIGQTPKGVM